MDEQKILALAEHVKDVIENNVAPALPDVVTLITDAEKTFNDLKPIIDGGFGGFLAEVTKAPTLVEDFVKLFAEVKKIAADFAPPATA